MLKINNLQKKILKISTVISLVMISSFFLINKVSALETTSGIVPDIPEGFDNFIIVKRPNNLGYRLYAWKSTATVYVYNHLNTHFYFSSSATNNNLLNTRDVSAYNSNSNEWEYISQTGNSTWPFESASNIMATTVNILSHTGSTTYEAGYGLRPTSYEFNEDIDVTDISKIKINFELPEDTRNLGLELDYSVRVLESSNYEGVIGQPHIILKSLDENNNPLTDVLSPSYLTKDTIITNMCLIADCEQYKEYKTNPFEKMLTDITMEKVDLFINNYGASFIGQWDDFKDLAQRLIDEDYCTNLYYFDNFNMSLLPDSTVYEYSLEIDTINYEGSLNLNFISNLNYSIEYEYEEENEDYYVMIKMQNRAALVLIPKVYDINNSTSSSFLSDIYLYGTYDIELWENLETKNVFDRHNNYSNSVYSHYFDWHYRSSVLYIINKDINSDFTFIRFDSRYYNYVIKNYLNEEVTIINPNTGEDMIIPDISDLYKYDSPTDSRFSFNSFLKPVKFVFESITNFYNNYCPEVVQYFFYLIFAFFVILVLIKIFL